MIKLSAFSAMQHRLGYDGLNVIVGSGCCQVQSSPHAFSIASLNIHKGLSPLNRRVVIHDVKRELDNLKPDLVFLQEVQDAHDRHAARFAEWPAQAQSHFLAASHWPEVHYGKNAIYAHGHHGNAILSRFAVREVSNDNVSMHRFESRGLLHALVEIGGQVVHCYCVHLSLTERARRNQVDLIVDAIADRSHAAEPVIVAGDFNDWRNRVGTRFAQAGLTDVFASLGAKLPRTFPGRLPLLRLDRIYVRGLKVIDARALHHMNRLSDHIGLVAQLELA